MSAEPVVQVGRVGSAELAVRAASVEQVVQVGLLELAVLVVRAVVPELEIVPAAEREPRRVEGLELVPEVEARVLVRAAVAVPGHPHDRLAVPRKTKSVIAAHHRAKVRLHARGEALAAAAETTPEQAATEAAKAWVVAG